MNSETSQTDQSWLSTVSWKAALIYVALSVIGGGATGAGLIATKAVSAQTSGISQDQADVRYLTKNEADRRSDVRDKQFEEIKREMVKQGVFDERTKTILDQIQLLRQDRKDDREYYERILSNR